MKVGIVGNGFVGQSTALFANKDIDIIIYDVLPDKCVPSTTTIYDIAKTDVVFVCVPTPSNKDGSCFTGWVEDVVTKLNTIKSDSCSVIVRSTVTPGTCDKLKCHHMPEFIREKHWQEDFINTSTWIVGLHASDKSAAEKMSKLINLAFENKSIKSNKVHFTVPFVTELAKYARNSFLALKVSYCNELAQFCRVKGVDYSLLADLLGEDKRIGSSHTDVPGHDDKYGYGGVCFPKDILALSIEMKKADVEPIILDASIKRNTTVDRPEQDWKKDKGRAVV